MTSENNLTKPSANLPDYRDPSNRPLNPKQEDRYRVVCKEAGDVDCGFEYEGMNVDEVKDALQGHYMDAHPGHKINDAYLLTMADHYSGQA